MDIETIDHLIENIQKPGKLSHENRDDLLIMLNEQRKVIDRDRLIDALSYIANGNVLSGDWHESVHRCFEQIGKSICADRIRFYDYGLQPDTGEPGLKVEVEWVSDTSNFEFDQNGLSTFILRKKFSKLFKAFEQGSSFQTRISEQELGPMKTFMQANKSQSVLFLPIRSNISFYGLICIDNCNEEVDWTSSELTLLQPIIFQFRNLLEKRDLENELQHTYRQARIGTWEMNLETGTFSWSPVTKEIFDVDQDTQPDNQLAMEIMYDDDSKTEMMQAVERAKITGEPYDMEVKVKTTRGEMKWVRDTGQAEFKNGKCVRLYGIVQDIHKRKMAEQESEKNKRLLEAITQQTDVAVWVRNDNGKILFVNNQWKTIFGLERKNVNGASLYDLFDRVSADEMITSDRSVIENNKQVIFEEFIDTATGPRHFMVNKFPLKGISGLENAVGGIGTDITEIKKTEERLQQAEEKLREIIEHSTNLFYTHDKNHKLTYLSPQSIDFLGYHPEEAKRRWTEFVTSHPENEKGFARTQKAIETGEAQPPFELELIRGDGVKIWVEVNEAPVIKDGETVSIAGSLTDVTKRKEAQGEIRDSLREKETLLAEIHHRVKNNLAVVASLMQLQAMESDNEEVRGELLESVLRVKSMAGIHEHLYKTEDFSNLDFAHNLEMLISEIIDTMQSSVDIDLSFECDDVRLSVNQAIPCSLVVNEVITNIIKHGLKGRDAGQVVTRLHQTDNSVTLSIEDNGVGLPEDFNPESTKTLGMQLIKTLSDQLLGTFEFKSNNVGQGSFFTLTFENQAERSLHA